MIRQAASRRDAMRILLVDDEQRFAAAVRQGLEAEGLAVDIAHDGDEGLWMAQS
jgi:two-component system, OmpR family, response regulator